MDNEKIVGCLRLARLALQSDPRPDTAAIADGVDGIGGIKAMIDDRKWHGDPASTREQLKRFLSDLQAVALTVQPARAPIGKDFVLNKPEPPGGVPRAIKHIGEAIKACDV